MDLTKHPPRSPWETLGGVYMLPRSIDKMRGFLAGTVGDYRSHVGMSPMVFTLFGTDATGFEQIVRAHASDQAVLSALASVHDPSAGEIAACNLAMSGWPDGDTQGADWLHEPQWIGLRGRTDVVTGFDLMDLDEGRVVPVGGRPPSASATS